MAALQRLGLLVAAVVTMIAALVILLSSNLPQRAAFTGALSPGQLPVAPEIHALAPDFELLTLHGEPIRLSELRGRPVIVNFWATWCGPCIVEMPVLQSVFDHYQGEGLRILAVNMGEPPAAIREWQDAHGLTYDLLVDEAQVVSGRYWLRGQPSTYVISPEGVITDIFFGPVTEAALTAAIG